MISSSVGVAAGFAINDFVKDSLVLVGDIDTVYQNYLDDKAGVDKTTTTDSTRTRTDAKVSATGKIDAQAKSRGGFIAAGVAGGITKNDDSGETGVVDKISGKISGAEDKVVGTINSISNKFSNITSELSSKTKTSSTGTHTNPSISISVAGSGGLNFIDTTTRVDVSGMTIDLGGTAGSNLNAIAVNNTDVMAFAGTAGIMYQTAKKDTSGKSVGIAGAVGLNVLNNTTEAVVKNSTISNADDLNIFAVNGGTDVAAALGLQVSKNSGNAAGAYTMGGSVSINNIDNKVNAELNNTNVTGKSTLKTDVNVAAYESDLQITGGVQITLGQQKGAFGAAVNVSKINNDVSAKISGGTFNQINNVGVSALQAIAQINGAVTAGIVTGTDSSVSVMGAMIYNETDNNMSAIIDGANITASGKVAANAQDYLLGEDTTGFGAILDRADSGENSFIDTDGGDYYDVDASNEADGELDTPLKDQIKKGSLIVSGAMAISVADTAVGAGLSINDIDNDFKAEIKNSTINTSAGTVETNAKSDTFMVSAAGGVAVSKKNAAAGGSVIWNDISSEVNSGSTNSVITAGNYLSKAGNDARIIGVAGQVSAGKGPAIGLAFTYNKVVNKSNAFSFATKVNGPGYSVAGSQFLVNATNNGEIMNLALAVPVSNQVGIGGAVAINFIDSNANALIDNSYLDDAGVTKTVSGTTISNFESFSTTAAENSEIKSIAGTFAFGGEAAIGGAVAYNEINGSTQATVKNVALGGKNVMIKSSNDADIWTLAAGCGGAGEISVQGAAATSEISRTISAGTSNVTENKTDSSIDVLAESSGEINSNATVVSIGASAGVGAGVVVNRMSDAISSWVTGGVLGVKDLEVRAKAAQTIRTVGIAGSGGAYAGVSGSVAVNLLKNNVNSFIDGNANVVAEDNIGVVAQSDETLLNYSGTVAGGVVGVGAGVSVNDIQGNTKAYVENATVQAKGLSGFVSLNHGISNDQMNDGFIDDQTLNVKYTLEKERTATSKRGLVVDSSATHTLKSFVANAAIGGVSVAGTVNVSRISGETSARVSSSKINNGLTGGDVNINAGDYANLSGFVGTVSGGGGGIGLTSDSGIISRTTSAKIDGAKTGSTAKDVSVKAESKVGVSALDAGIGISGTHTVAGTVSINVLKSNTEAIVNNSNMGLNSLSVNADHWAKTSVVDGTLSVAGFVGVGGAVGINDVKDKVKAEVTGSNIAMRTNGSGKFEVQAINDITLNSIGAAAAGGFVGLAGNVGLNFIETDVMATVKNTVMTNRATDVTVKAADSLTIDSNLGTVAAGVLGAGVSAGVNILDGKTSAIVDGSKLYAVNSINVTADEAKNVTQNAFTAAAGVGAFAGNVVYISSGKLLLQSDEDGASNARDAVTSAESVNSGNIGETNGALTDAEKLSLNADGGKLSPSATGGAATVASVGKFESANGSTLDSQGTVDVKASENSDFSVIGGSGSVGFVAAGGSACFIEVNRNVGTKLNSATIISGNDTSIKAIADGETDLEMYQGSLAYLGAGTAAYGRIGNSGNVFAELSNSNLTSQGDLLVKSLDETSSTAESYGLTAGIISAGALMTQIDNDTSAKVTLNGNTLTSNRSGGAVKIEADRNNTLTAKSVGGALGILAAGTGVGSTIDDDGTAEVISTGGTCNSQGKISFDANSRPVATSEATSAALSGLVSAGVSVAKSELSGTAQVKVSGVNTFNAPEVEFNAGIDGKNNLVAEGVSGGFLTSFGFNLSKATNKSVINVLIGDSKYSNANTKLTLKGS
ncbi:MAG: beta strand repeat-containing protein, partial [Candidatus Rifleibacteriota bacterium]